MKIKNIISGVLLLFVGVSVAYLVTGGFDGKGRDAVSNERDVATQPAGGTGGDGAENVVIAYYFHGYKRCNTCRTIEAYTVEALETGFSDELRRGDLAWLVVNVEEPENEHYVEDYELATKTVVLVEVKDGEESRWTRLDEVWQLVGDKESFVDYIQESTREYLED